MKKEKFGNKAGKKLQLFSDFKGVDYAHAPSSVSQSRTVNGLNMVRSTVGKVQKRTGYEYDSHIWPDKVNGIHFLQLGEARICLVHCGTGFYVEGECIYSQAANSVSAAVQLKDRLYILDGKKFVFFDGTTVRAVSSEAYVPTVWINRTPGGGGKKYEQPNILTDKCKEGFVADGQTNIYILSQAYLGAAAVSATVHKDDGTVQTITEGNGISVDRVAGTVTFSSTPPLSKRTDTDNVYITYSKATGADKTVIDKCTVISVFGPGGRPDTLFLSGNPDHPGREWFSQGDNPVFFGLQNTDLAGSDNSPVVGYSTLGDKLFVHRKDNEGGLNILVRSCSGGDENKQSYPVVNALQGPSAVSAGSFVNMANDALFLTDRGVYAITCNEASGNHFTQLRSFFVNPHLLKNSKLNKAVAVSYNDFYVLAIGGDIYLLDTLQKSFVADKEYSDWQYECYHWHIDSDIHKLFCENGRLCFVTSDGRTGRFYTDYSNPFCFNDDGKAITAIWQTGDFTADVFMNNKNIYRLWVVCDTALRTGVNVKVQIKGVWKEIFSDMTSARFFQWSAIQWSKFTWSTDKTPKLMKQQVRIRNVDKAAFRLENASLNEPFGLYEFGFEYTTGSYYR